MQLLVVPAVLATIGILFTWQQNARQADIEDQRSQDAALQAYLDQMNTLLLEHDLRNSKVDSEVRTLARARTLTVLGRLDPSRKEEVMQFLWEAELVQGAILVHLSGHLVEIQAKKGLPIINLGGGPERG